MPSTRDEAAPLLPSTNNACYDIDDQPPSYESHIRHWSFNPFSRSSRQLHGFSTPDEGALATAQHAQSPSADSSLESAALKPTHSNGDPSRARTMLRHLLTSRFGHYAVLALVALDVACIFADFLITIFQCENRCADGVGEDPSLTAVQTGLGVVSLLFSCLFMFELGASIYAFGFGYFRSTFHVVDATVIVAGFVLDVCLKGVLEEAGSIIVVLRLWRVFKIIEEFSAGAEEQMDGLNEHIEKLIEENKELRRQVASLGENAAEYDRAFTYGSTGSR